jgi:hypothetical protein
MLKMLFSMVILTRLFIANNTLASLIPNIPHICLLLKSFYGLKQAPRAWFQRFSTFAKSIGFLESKSDASLFILRKGSDIAYLLLYVNDIILTASTPLLLANITHIFSREFSMKDLGPLYHFLGISVTHTTTGIHLSQHHYFLEILSYAGMRDCHLVLTPIDTKSKLSSTVGSPVSDPSLYRSLVGSLQYDVQQVCLHMHDPREPHFCLIKHILGYIKGTLHHSLTLHRSTSHSLVALFGC